MPAAAEPLNCSMARVPEMMMPFLRTRASGSTTGSLLTTGGSETGGGEEVPLELCALLSAEDSGKDSAAEEDASALPDSVVEAPPDELPPMWIDVFPEEAGGALDSVPGPPQANSAARRERRRKIDIVFFIIIPPYLTLEAQRGSCFAHAPRFRLVYTPAQLSRRKRLKELQIIAAHR